MIKVVENRMGVYIDNRIKEYIANISTRKICTSF